jgi:hypothetical protein
MTEKTPNDILSELPNRALYLGGESGSIPPTYRPITIDDLVANPGQVIMMEIDPDEGGLPMAITWWPAGMVSKEVQRGIPMPVKLAFTEVRMLMAINKIARALVTMDPNIPWDPDWPIPDKPKAASDN